MEEGTDLTIVLPMRFKIYLTIALSDRGHGKAAFSQGVYHMLTCSFDEVLDSFDLFYDCSAPPIIITHYSGQVSYLNALLHGCTKIFFVGSFLRHNPIRYRTHVQ